MADYDTDIYKTWVSNTSYAVNVLHFHIRNMILYEVKPYET